VEATKSVATEQAETFAGLHFKANAVDGGHAAEPIYEILNAQRRGHQAFFPCA